MDNYFKSDQPLEKYPLGTKAEAIGGGYWIKVKDGWKWCTGDTFPRPGGDWSGRVSLPPQSENAKSGNN